MMNFDVVDLSERHSAEVMFLLKEVLIRWEALSSSRARIIIPRGF